MITITKNNIISSPFTLKRMPVDSEDVSETEISDLVFLLGEYVELGNDVTFERLFDIMLIHKTFLDQVYHFELNGISIGDFIDDYEKKFDISPDFQEYRIMVSRESDVYEVDGEVEYYEHPVIDAFGKMDNRIDDENYIINLSFSPLGELRDKIVFLNNEFEIQNERSYDDELEASFKSNYRPFTIYDLFKAIISEISQYGTPEDREKIYKDVVKNNEELGFIEDESMFDFIENDEKSIRDKINGLINKEPDDIDNLTYWDKLYPSDKSKKKSSQDIHDNAIIALSDGASISLEDMLKEAHESENYEKAAKIKKLIERRNKKRNK